MALQATRTTLAGSETVQRPGLLPGGSIPDGETIHVTVVLRRKGSAGLLQSVRNLLHLSHQEHAAEHGATDADVALVEHFAHEFGLTVVEASAAKRRVILAGTAEQMHEAFGVDFICYTQESSGKMFRGRQGTLSIPSDLKGVVEAVLGFDTRPIAEPHFRPRQTSAVGFTPQQVAALYSFPANVTGKGQTVAIIELGGGYKAADLKTYFSGFGLATPKVTAISVDGGKNTPGGDADGEVLLDIEVVGAVANGASIAVYFAPNTDQGFIDAITDAVHDTKRKPSVVSISWGGPEDSWSQQSRDALNSALQDAATLGVTVTVASGDNGSTDGVGDGKLHVDFPASSPFALACGGTTLRGSGSTITSETVWNETANQEGATGGGVSTVFALPAYQNNANVPVQPQTSFAGRGVPDIAGNADPTTGYQVRVDGQNTVVGGTSAVAPLWAGLVALLNQQLGTPVGFLNPKLYALTPGAFHDITSGTNDDANLGYYSARAGWDPCTGLGTPNGTALLQALAAAGTTGQGRTPLAGSSPQHSPTAQWSKMADAGEKQLTVTMILKHAASDTSAALLSGTAPALPHGEASTASTASPAAVQSVVAFAREHGLTVTEANASTRTVKVQGTAEQLGRAFGVTLEMVTDGGGNTYLSHQGPIAIPASLAGEVTAVLGLDQRPIARHHASS